MSASKGQTNFPCGVVEGFYGPPWSHLDRLYMIRFLGESGFNAYMYAPKDDEYHRSEWRKEYPENLSLKLRELVSASNYFSVNFIFTVSPGLSIRYSNAEDLRLLLTKLETVIDMGCSWVGILLDDIDTELKHDEDRASFSSLAKAHAQLLNNAKDALAKRGVRLTFCPTYYANHYLGKDIQNNDYLLEIGEEMECQVDILWTGSHVVAARITEEDAVEFERVIRRKPLLWDNYPVNDYLRASEGERKLGLRLNLGPFTGRSPKALEHLSGYLANPMNECEASKIPLLTLADLLRDPQRYSPQEAYRRAVFHFLSSEEDETRQQLELLLSCSKASALDPLDEAQELRKLVQEAMAAYRRNDEYEWKKITAHLRAQLKDYSSLGSILSSSVRNKKLLIELAPVISKVTKFASLGIAILDMCDAKRSNAKDLASRNDKMNEAAKEVEEDNTQALGQVAFSMPKEMKSEESSDVNRMGLPLVRSESPVIELYHFAKDSS